MIKYDQTWLNNLCSQVDLLDYASQQFEFRRSGSDSYAAKCNKHGDDDPSLVITPSKNMWYCFGCKRGGNIINWLMVYEGLSFQKAVEKIASIVGEDIPDFKNSPTLSLFKAVSTKPKEKHVEHKILPATYLRRFKIPKAGEPHEWIDEGISAEAIKYFGVRIDDKSNRIIYPVYDNDGNLINVKGRTRFQNYKVLGISKYMNYEKLGTTDFFQGMKENREDILKSGEIIIFEGVKSVMKAWGWGYRNCVAAETSRLNDEQVKILLKMRLNSVTLAFDNDVPYSQLKEAADKLKKYVNLYLIYDSYKLLGKPEEKRAPVDCGKEIWDKLYGERKRII